MRLLPMTSGPHPARRKMSLGAHPRTSSFIAYAMNAWFHVIRFSVHASTASRPHRYCRSLASNGLLRGLAFIFFIVPSFLPAVRICVRGQMSSSPWMMAWLPSGP